MTKAEKPLVPAKCNYEAAQSMANYPAVYAGCVNCEEGWIAFDDGPGGPGGVAPCPTCRPDAYVETRACRHTHLLVRNGLTYCQRCDTRVRPEEL